MIKVLQKVKISKFYLNKSTETQNTHLKEDAQLIFQ